MLDRTDEVSRTKDNAIFNGCEFLRAEIQLAIHDLTERARILDANMKTLDGGFTAKNMPNIKLAAENLASIARDAKRTVAQIEALSNSLSTTFAVHINRRPRV